MQKYVAVVAICSVMLTSCGPTTSGPQPISDRLEMTAELTIDGRQLSQTWTLPAARQTFTSGPGDFVVAMNPLWAPLTAFEKRTTSVSIQPASDGGRRLFLMKLPTGEGIGIDIGGLSVNAGSPNSERTTTAAPLYLFDSADHPTKLFEQRFVDNVGCPAGFRATACSVRVTLKRVGPGAASALSSRIFVFVSMEALTFKIADLRSNPELTSLVSATGSPTIVTIEPPMQQRIRNQAVGPARRQHLTYVGGTVWALPTATLAENQIRQLTRYVTTLPAKDVRCCGSSQDGFEAGAQKNVSGQIEYEGQMFAYPPWRESDRKPPPAIIDPAASTITYIRPVAPKLIELVSLR